MLKKMVTSARSSSARRYAAYPRYVEEDPNYPPMDQRMETKTVNQGEDLKKPSLMRGVRHAKDSNPPARG